MAENPSRSKSKNSKRSSAKSKKKEKEGTKCAFFSELARRWSRLNKERDEDDDGNFIVNTIIESVTRALPVKYHKPVKRESLKQIDVQKIAPELLPNDTVEVPKSLIEISNPELIPLKEPSPVPSPRGFVIPRMPLINSDVFKTPVPKKKKKTITLDASMNTESEETMADELVKHVHTLRKISLIAEEFNKKTARNLKEIVESVQEDLIKKIEEMRSQEGKPVTLTRVGILEK